METSWQAWLRSVPQMVSPSRSPAACRFHACHPPRPKTRATWCTLAASAWKPAQNPMVTMDHRHFLHKHCLGGVPQAKHPNIMFLTHIPIYPSISSTTANCWPNLLIPLVKSLFLWSLWWLIGQNTSTHVYIYIKLSRYIHNKSPIYPIYGWFWGYSLHIKLWPLADWGTG